MELVDILREVWRHKAWTVLVVCAAVAAAISVSYKVSVNPPGLGSKSLEAGAASTRFLVDTPRSSLADLNKDFLPLAERAAVFAQFMRSGVMRKTIADVAGAPADQIVSSGPDLGATQQPAAEVRANDITGEGSPYRLIFDAGDPNQTQIPIVSVYAQAPTADKAVALADGSVTGLQRYLRSASARDGVPSRSQVQIRQLGKASGGVVGSGASKVTAFLAFLAVLIAGSVAIVVASSGVQRWGELKRAEEDRPSDNGASFPYNNRGHDPEQLPAGMGHPDKRSGSS